MKHSKAYRSAADKRDGAPSQLDLLSCDAPAPRRVVLALAVAGRFRSRRARFRARQQAEAYQA